jgi:hypothetical protein
MVLWGSWLWDCGWFKIKKRKEKGDGNLVEKRCPFKNNRASERIETNK